MELYKKYPKLAVLWCCVEIMLYPGQLFGWSSLQFVLKQEGFYSDICEPKNENKTLLTSDDIIGDMSNASDFLVVSFSESKVGGTPLNTSGLVTRNDANNNKRSDGSTEECYAQDARLNLWFSVAVSFSCLMCSLLGPLIKLTGMRSFRLLFITVYVVGLLCLAFATSVSAWLICPGLCCIGIGGMALYATNLHVSFLFPAMQSTITAVFVGIFDVSSIIPQLVKVAFESGVPRKFSFVTLAIIHILLLGTSTFIILPFKRIDPFAVHKTQKKKDVEQLHEEENFLQKNVQDICKIATESNIQQNCIFTISNESKHSLRQTVFSGRFMLHIYWMCVKVLRFVTFIGTLNVWLRIFFKEDQAKESHYLGVFSYITMGTIISGVTAGRLHDWQRKLYLGENKFRRLNMPIIIPLLMTTIISLACTACTLVQHEGALYITFVLFTLYRTFVYSYEVTYINDAFPLEHFTQLYGIISSCAGLVGMVQYALFEWYESYNGSPMHVTIFLLLLELSTLVHPLNIWYQCHRHKGEPKTSGLTKDIVEPQTGFCLRENKDA